MIEFRNVTYAYDLGTSASIEAIKNINLVIKAGELVAIIGRTGSGKSTLIEHMNGLKKPIRGQVFIAGKDIWQKGTNIREIRLKVGMVFQYPERQIFEQDVYSEIAFGPKNKGFDKKEIERCIFEALDFMELPKDILYEVPFTFSGGYKRKIAIASIIAMQPEILVLDEPTAGLDPYSAEKLLKNLKIYHEERKKTIILISHNMEEVTEFAERIIIIDKGEIKIDGNTSEIFQQKNKLREFGLDIPEISNVFLKLAKMGIKTNNNINTVKKAINEFFRLKGTEGE